VSQPTTTPQPAPSQDAGIPATRDIAVAAGSTATAQLPPVELTASSDTPGAAPDEVQPTGPVDFVPGPPGVDTAPPATAAHEPKAPKAPKAPRAPRTPQDRAALIGTGLTVLSLALLELGLVAAFGTDSLWSTVPLWSAFATLAALLGLLPSVARLLPGARLRPDAAWKVAAGGLTGLAVFWVLVVLPRVDSDRGFVLTAALAALGAALWVAPARRG
jgi:hypothetical protein